VLESEHLNYVENNIENVIVKDYIHSLF